MTLAQFTEMIDQRTLLMPVTVDQYHQMLENGIVPEGEPYELLEGHVIRKDRSAVGEDPMTVGHDHTWVVGELNELNAKLKPFGCHMRVQSPLSLPPYDEPEPDGVIVSGARERYRKRNPSAADVLCVIEVAEASLKRDRTVKQAIYADSQLPVYVIINLPDRMIELYSQPLAGKGRYGQSTTLTPRQSVVFPVAGGKHVKVAAKQLLP